MKEAGGLSGHLLTLLPPPVLVQHLLLVLCLEAPPVVTAGFLLDPQGQQPWQFLQPRHPLCFTGEGPIAVLRPTEPHFSAP